MVSTETFKKANDRGGRRRASGPVAVAARYDRRVHRVVVRLASGIEIGFLTRNTEGLETAKPEDLDAIEISPSGLGLHFPKLDADLYLPALLEGVLGSSQWMAAQLGQKGGRARSASKRHAARENGRLGGRPKASPSA